MSKLRVAVLFGGKSGEHEISIISALSVYKALDKTKYEVTLVGIDKTGRWLLPDQSKILAQSENPRLIALNQSKNSISFIAFESEKSVVAVSGGTLPANVQTKYDVIIPILHGTYGEDGTIQGLLELANVPYVGSGVLGSSVGMDKELAKRVFRDAGISVVPFFALKRKEFASNPKNAVDRAVKEFGLPFFVKPANLGSSVGVHKVKRVEEAEALIRDALTYDTKVLVEKGISARELEVAVLGNDEPQASIVGEIKPNSGKHEFYSYEAKYMDPDGAELFIPAKDMTAAQMKKIQEMAIAAFKSIECAGLARVDFFMDKVSGEVFINELNTIPGFTSISMYPKLWEASGVPYSKLIDKLIEFALARHKEKNSLKTTYEPVKF